MQAVIMAGGKGTRLSSITKNQIPKPMVDILGKPLLEWQILKLKEYGFTDICLVIGHLGHVIKDYFGDGSSFGIQISYVEEEEPLGTAGALYYLKDWVKEENFLMVFGDVFFDIDLSKMWAFHTDKNAILTMFVHPNAHPFDSDLVVLDNDSRVLNIDSKNNVRDYWYKNMVNAGLYIMNRAVCDAVKKPEKLDLEKDIISSFLRENQAVCGYKSPEYIKDVGTVDRIQSTINDIESGFISKRNLCNKQKCIFLDRDGTINVYKGLLHDIDEFELESTVAEAITAINKSEWLCIVVTNQPVVARGMCDLSDVDMIHDKMETLLGNAGAFVDDVFYCPHHPDKGYPEENPEFKVVCHCRKPDIGMLEEAAARYNIDLENSWIIGDSTIDIQTGINAGMKTALVKTGVAGEDHKYDVSPDLEGTSLLQVVEKIVG